MEPPASTAPLADVSNDGAPRVPAQRAVLDKPASEIRAPPPSATSPTPTPTPTPPAVAAASSPAPVADAADAPAPKRSKRAPVEQPPKPLTRPLPEALAEWKDYVERELAQLHVFRKQGLLDWPLVKGVINCAVVSCPVAHLRAEIRDLRENGVYGSSMVPYLQVLRQIFDSAENHADDAETEPIEFSESDDSSEDDSEDDSEDSEDSGEETAEETAAVAVEGVRRSEDDDDDEDEEDDEDEDDRRRAREEKAAERKRGVKGASGEPSKYQVEMRGKYKVFSRFLGTYFAEERVEQAAVADLLARPDAEQFTDAEVVAFLNMLERENKVMLHEGTVVII